MNQKICRSCGSVLVKVTLKGEEQLFCLACEQTFPLERDQ
jgi:formamidopyrimidine-DNA glycosylase